MGAALAAVRALKTVLAQGSWRDYAQAVRDRVVLIVGPAVLAVAFLLGSVVLAGGIRDRNRNDVLTVTGSAKRRIVSDYVVWSVLVTSQQPTAAAAARQLSAWTRRIRAFLGQQGARRGEVSVQPISTETVSGKGRTPSRGVAGYRLTRTFEVRSARVKDIAQLAERSSRLLAQGIPLAAQPPQYSYTRLAALRPQVLSEAVKDAQTRARALIDAAGGDLGKLRGVNVGVFQVTAPNSTEVSDYGVYDTTTLNKDVTAVVNVTFALS